MKLNISILLEQLSDMVICSKNDYYSDELYLNRPEHYIAQEALLSEHLYIANQLSLPDLLQTESGACIISVGKLSEEFFRKHISIICVSEEISILELFNKVQAIFDRYDSWDQRLQQCVNSNSDIQDMIDISDTVFGNPIFFSDSDYRILAESHNNPLKIKYNYIPERCLNELKESEDYEKMWKSGIPMFSYHDDRHLSIVVRSQGKFVIFISIMEANISFRDSDPILLKHMANYAQLHYEQNQNRNNRQYTSLDYILKKFLNKQQVLEQTLEKALEAHDWKMFHQYYICNIELTEEDIRYNMMKTQCDQIIKIFTTAVIVFEYQSNLCAIINTSLLTDSGAESKMCLFLKNSKLKAGKSREFRNINHVRNYYIQAASALELGKKSDSNIDYYRFEDYCLEYILKSSCVNMLPESLCPSGLIQMQEYDNIHGTQYVLTLKTYFEEKFNATHAANKLYIHRTTFLERLHKISNFLDMNLEDARTRLYLMISLEIINF